MQALHLMTVFMGVRFVGALLSSLVVAVVSVKTISSPIQSIQSNEYNGSRPRPLFPSLSKNLNTKTQINSN